MAEGAVTILPKRASVDGEAGKHKTARRGNETDHVSEDVLKEVIVVKTFSYFSQRLTVTSRAAPCPTTAGTSGSLSSGRRTSAASWGCTARDPAAPRNVQVGNTGGNTEVKGQHGPREETSFVTQQKKTNLHTPFLSVSLSSSLPHILLLYLNLSFSTSSLLPLSRPFLLCLVLLSIPPPFSSSSFPSLPLPFFHFLLYSSSTSFFPSLPPLSLSTPSFPLLPPRHSSMSSFPPLNQLV